ncbi:MAG: hypothetical protein IPJ69_07135 [Deltaproteobacteria bacterium]|nr:MAG: hypothetical protein IPJ69_07135 [Deltaproteobacteria bacterium]
MDLGTVTHLRQWVEALQATLGSSSGISLDLREPGRKLLDNLPGGPLALSSLV